MFLTPNAAGDVMLKHASGTSFGSCANLFYPERCKISVCTCTWVLMAFTREVRWHGWFSRLPISFIFLFLWARARHFFNPSVISRFFPHFFPYQFFVVLFHLARFVFSHFFACLTILPGAVIYFCPPLFFPSRNDVHMFCLAGAHFLQAWPHMCYNSATDTFYMAFIPIFSSCVLFLANGRPSFSKYRPKQCQY